MRKYFTTALAAFAISVALSRAAYLSRVGPAPLRFQTTAVNAASVARLPPLLMTNEMIARAEPPVAVAKSPPPAETLEPLGPVLLPAEDPIQIPVSPIPATTPVNVAVETNTTPNIQTLVRFFAPAGNTNREIGIIAPVFTPPSPAPRSSSATYEKR